MLGGVYVFSRIIYMRLYILMYIYKAKVLRPAVNFRQVCRAYTLYIRRESDLEWHIVVSIINLIALGIVQHLQFPQCHSRARASRQYINAHCPPPLQISIFHSSTALLLLSKIDRYIVFHPVPRASSAQSSTD